MQYNMEKNIKRKICEKQKVTFECIRQQLWLKKKTKNKNQKTWKSQVTFILILTFV